MSACSKESNDPEEKIRQVITAIELAAEQKSATTVIEYLANDYNDKHHQKRQQVIRSLLGYFYRKKNIFLFSRISNIKLDPNDETKAEASVIMAMTATQVDAAEKLLTLKADIYRFDIKVSSIYGSWLITTGSWKKDSASSFLESF